MTTFVVATDSLDASSRLADYLTGRVGGGDTVHAVNSQVGGDGTTAESIRAGEAAIEAIADALGGTTTVETHQFVRGNDPAEDVLAFADDVDADELVIALRRRSPAGKLLFGSVAQDLLLNADRPVVAVPRG